MHFSKNLLSPQYARLKELGHTRPVPVFGSPTLVMYVSIWPRSGTERLEIREILASHVGEADGIREGFAAARETYSERYKKFIAVIERTVNTLQKRGSTNTPTDYVQFQWSTSPYGYPSEWEEQEWFKPFAKPSGPQDRERGQDRDNKQKHWWFPQLQETLLLSQSAGFQAISLPGA